jgi:hypothetical protein
MSMKNILPLVLLSAAGNAAFAADADLAKRVEALEYQSYENTLSWSGFLESRYDSYTVKPSGGDKYTLNISRNLAALDFKAKPLPNVSVFGRIAYSNVFNNQTPSTSDPGSRKYNSALASVERLFVNYGITDDLTFSVGRLPTLDGPPGHMHDGIPRQGSYPRQVYSAALDGYALTYKIPLPSETQNLSFRLVYTPLSHILVAGTGTGAIAYSRDEVTSTNLQTGAQDPTGSYSSSTTPLTSWMLDYNWDGAGFARTINLIYQGFMFKDYKLEPTWKFDYSVNALYAEISDIASLGINFYEAYSKTKVVNEGGKVVVPNVVAVSLGANKLDATVEGSASITGITYTLPVNALKNPILGYEMYKGDKNSLQFDFGAKDPGGFYTMRGKGTHVFYTQPLNQNMRLRFGMMDYKHEYASGLPFRGESAANDDKMTSIYANLRTDF